MDGAGVNPGDRELYEALIGPRNTEYYLSYFERAETRGYSPLSWHWPAIFGVLWFLYRKQYGWGLIIMAISMAIAIVTSLLASAIGTENAGFLQLALLVGFQMIWIPLNANGIYYRWAKQRIVAAREAFPNLLHEQLAMLSVQGGVNRYAPLILFFVLFAMSMVTARPPG